VGRKFSNVSFTIRLQMFVCGYNCDGQNLICGKTDENMLKTPTKKSKIYAFSTNFNSS